MARLSVREYEHIPAISNGTVLVGLEPAVAKYSITISGTAASGQVFNVRTKFVRLQCDVQCSIDIGAVPNAVAGEGTMSAGSVEYFGVAANSSHRISVVAE